MDPGQKRQGVSKYEETNLKTRLELPKADRYEDGQNSDTTEALRLKTDTSNILMNPSIDCQNDNVLKISKCDIKTTASPTRSRELQKDKQQFELIEGGKSSDDNLSKLASQNSALQVCKKYEENLARYLKETENCIKIRFRKKKIENERLIKSDGEITKSTDVSKISSTLTKLTIGRSSAPSTFSDEKENNKMTANKIPFFSTKSENNNFRDCKQSATEISKLAVPSPADVLPTKASEMKQNTSKVLPSTTNLDLPDKSAKSETDPYEPSKVEKRSTTTPSPNRPSDFNVKRRQAFYIFAPGSSTGILRQCKSLPEISRFRRREAMQRWSMNVEQHLRNVSFGNEPRQSTQEVRSSSDVGNAYKSVARIPNEASEISRTVPQERGTDLLRSLLLDRRPKNALFINDSNEMGNTESFDEAESFQKRKEISPVAEYPFPSMKKGRISSEFEENEIDTIDDGTEDSLSTESETPPSEKDEGTEDSLSTESETPPSEKDENNK